MIISWYLYLDYQANCGFFDNNIPVVPKTWYHVCFGIDTVTGLLRIVDNGVLIVNEEKEYFKNSASIKPEKLAGSLLGTEYQIIEKIRVKICTMNWAKKS